MDNVLQYHHNKVWVKGGDKQWCVSNNNDTRMADFEGGLTTSDIYNENAKFDRKDNNGKDIYTGKIEKQEPYYPASLNVICYKRTK